MLTGLIWEIKNFVITFCAFNLGPMEIKRWLAMLHASYRNEYWKSLRDMGCIYPLVKEFFKLMFMEEDLFLLTAVVTFVLCFRYSCFLNVSLMKTSTCTLYSILNLCASAPAVTRIAVTACKHYMTAGILFPICLEAIFNNIRFLENDWCDWVVNQVMQGQYYYCV